MNTQKTNDKMELMASSVEVAPLFGDPPPLYLKSHNAPLANIIGVSYAQQQASWWVGCSVHMCCKQRTLEYHSKYITVEQPTHKKNLSKATLSSQLDATNLPRIKEALATAAGGTRS